MGILEDADRMCAALSEMPEDERIDTLNAIREKLHAVSPFSSQPVDLVRWVRATSVVANAYNPNSVAPPEMELLSLSIKADGYTQPIVVNRESTGHEVVDGFHRSRVGKEVPEVRALVRGYLPVVQIRSERVGVHDRMASTIRHNRARGKHGVDEMSSIVAELTKKGWDDEKIGKELGMEPDEVLRLKQITGLAELFRDRAFSEAWEIDEGAL